MKNSIYSLFTVVFSVIFVISPSYAGNTLISTLNDQAEVSVTVYNSNLGLVKDLRKLNLPVGTGELRFSDVASGIMPVTVRAKSLNLPTDFNVIEQNFEYDLINSKKLLDKYIGKKIKIITWNEFQDRKTVTEAELLSNNDGPIYKINDEIYLGYPGYKVVPDLPENFVAKPTLMWLYNNKTASIHNIEVSYLTSGISWKADYVLTLNKDDTSADLAGWVTVDNRSGAMYKDATLKLVAGEVNRVNDNDRDMVAFAGYSKMKAASMPAPQFEEKEFFEYHIYDLQRKTTIKNNQTKQVSLLEAMDVGTKKEYLTYGQRYYRGYHNDDTQKQPVNVYVSLKNNKESNLGMPLPAGTVRLYKKDSAGSLQFVGEDSIKHTPKDEDVRLRVGEAFDIVCERKLVDYKEISSRQHEYEWEVTIRNRKENTDINVGIIEPVYGTWEIISKSHPFKKHDAFTLRFDVVVTKETKLRYRVRVGL
ncbi:MAG: DUF4139 domain-containing protein [Elusimicrobiota bacterium]